jgi:subfamily B ATP-binding cassette protein HlyB/CyaB
VNRLKGKVTMLFIAHQLPKGLQTDGAITLGERVKRMNVVGEERGAS